MIAADKSPLHSEQVDEHKFAWFHLLPSAYVKSLKTVDLAPAARSDVINSTTTSLVKPPSKVMLTGGTKWKARQSC